jgi:hypothetical protein
MVVSSSKKLAYQVTPFGWCRVMLSCSAARNRLDTGAATMRFQRLTAACSHDRTRGRQPNSLSSKCRGVLLRTSPANRRINRLCTQCSSSDIILRGVLQLWSSVGSQTSAQYPSTGATSASNNCPCTCRLSMPKPALLLNIPHIARHTCPISAAYDPKTCVFKSQQHDFFIMFFFFIQSSS